MKTIVRYDNDNYIKEVTKIYDNKVITETYRKVLGGTQWFFYKENPPKNYNNCWMKICSKEVEKNKYYSDREKYCKKVKKDRNFNVAVVQQSSLPVWAQKGSGQYRTGIKLSTLLNICKNQKNPNSICNKNRMNYYLI